MDSIKRIRDQVAKLVEDGRRVAELGCAVWEKKNDAEHPAFSAAYQGWYRRCLGLLKANDSSASDEFTKHYDDGVKTWTTIRPSDYYGPFDGAATLRNHIPAQVALVASLPPELEGRAMEIQTELSYEYIADEYDQAQVLSDLGFFRAAGAVAGVALERNVHFLAHKNNVQVTPNPPTKSRADFSDYLTALKKHGAINEMQRKQYEALYEVRKQCSHPGEPCAEDIARLIRDGKQLAAAV